MPADYGRIHRLLRIITLIQSQDGWTAERLAKDCKVATRTLFRDMAILESVGIPYFHDPVTNGYRIHRDYFMPPVELSLDEALAVVALGEHIGKREQIPLIRSAGKAIEKVRAHLPRPIQDELGKIERHITIDLARATPPDAVADVYDKVRWAIARGKVLRCSYESIALNRRKDAGDGDEVFAFRPYALFFAQRAWYAVGHHSGRDALRTLKLNRFTAIQATVESYTIPETFNLREHLGHAWRMIRGDTRYDVAVRFDPLFADGASETFWHPTQQADFHDDGSITLRFSVDGLDEIVWWVLSMGPHCQVLEPPDLIARVRDLAQGIVNRYPPGSAPAPGSPGSPGSVAKDDPTEVEKKPRKRAAGDAGKGKETGRGGNVKLKRKNADSPAGKT